MKNIATKNIVLPVNAIHSNTPNKNNGIPK